VQFEAASSISRLEKQSGLDCCLIIPICKKTFLRCRQRLIQGRVITSLWKRPLWSLPLRKVWYFENIARVAIRNGHPHVAAGSAQSSDDVADARSGLMRKPTGAPLINTVGERCGRRRDWWQNRGSVYVTDRPDIIWKSRCLSQKFPGPIGNYPAMRLVKCKKHMINVFGGLLKHDRMDNCPLEARRSQQASSLWD
jgi:hypothetical protein